MNKLLLIAVFFLMACSSDDVSNDNLTALTIEGKWVYPENSLNTMYIYEAGIRYTYYCVGSDCESQYESFQAADGNHLPAIHPYTFENNILTVDLHFGNTWEAPLTFECDGDKVIFNSPDPYYLNRLGSDCN